MLAFPEKKRSRKELNITGADPQPNGTAVDENLMREQHPSMPIHNDRKSRVSFGGQKKINPSTP